MRPRGRWGDGSSAFTTTASRAFTFLIYLSLLSHVPLSSHLLHINIMYPSPPTYQSHCSFRSFNEFYHLQDCRLPYYSHSNHLPQPLMYPSHFTYRSHHFSPTAAVPPTAVILTLHSHAPPPSSQLSHVTQLPNL